MVTEYAVRMRFTRLRRQRGLEAPDVTVIIGQELDVNETKSRQLSLKKFSLFSTQFDQQAAPRSKEARTFSYDATQDIESVRAAVIRRA